MIDNLIKKNKLVGGRGDFTSTGEIDPTQLSTGIQIEMEHTNDPDIAKEIAIDHLTKDSEYYIKLIKCGLASEFNASSHSGLGDPTHSFNDPARVGMYGSMPGNIKGKIGGTSNGQVSGKPSNPIVDKSANPLDGYGNYKPNKTIDIELQERNKKIQNIIKKIREIDMNNNINRNPIQAFDGPFPAEVSSDGLGTFSSGYDLVGYAETKKNMNKQRIQEIIKSLSGKSLREQDEETGVDTSTTTTPDQDQITLTIDRETAQKLHNLLMQVLKPEGDGAALDASSDTDTQLPSDDIGQDDENSAENSDDEGSEQSAIGEITFEQSKNINDTKQKWRKKTVDRKGTLDKHKTPSNMSKNKSFSNNKNKSMTQKNSKNLKNLAKHPRVAMEVKRLRKK
jgi:hypothetical protein